MGVGAGRLRPRRLARRRQDELRRRHAVAYRNLGRRHVRRCDGQAGLGVNTRYLGWGTGFVDVDLDCWPRHPHRQRPCVSGGRSVGGRYSYDQQKLLYRNLGNGRFEDVSMRADRALLDKKRARGAAFGDLFNTGTRMSSSTTCTAPPSLLHDCAPPAGHSLVVQLVGTRSNRSAIGARVTVSVAGRRLIDEVRSGGSFCSQNDLRVHVGLGAPDACRSHRGRLAERRDRDDLRRSMRISWSSFARASGVVRRERWRAARWRGVLPCRPRRTAVSCRRMIRARTSEMRFAAAGCASHHGGVHGRLVAAATSFCAENARAAESQSAA